MLGILAAAIVTLAVFAAYAQAPKAPPKSEEGPPIPGTPWKVHDEKRPQPRVVDPGTAGTPDAPGRPPSDAVILFDGKDTSHWVGKEGKPITWKVENGYMEPAPKSGGISTTDKFGDCQLHVEWATPAVVKGNSQGRGNSGVILMGMYEIQVLDCYENKTYADGGAASIYGQSPPLVNACRKPGEWQTYDILWEAPRFDGKNLARPAYVTVIHNGVVVHNHKEVIGATRHKALAQYSPHPPVGPLSLQDHGNPIRYRNIWYRPLKDYDQP
jgi:hypothetical protein